MRMEHKSPLPDIEPPRLFVKSPVPPFAERIEIKHQPHTSEHTKSNSCKESFNESHFPNKSHLQNELDRPLNKLQTSMNSSETIKYSSYKSAPAPEPLPCDLNKSSRDEQPRDVCFDQRTEFSLVPGPPPQFGYLPDAAPSNSSMQRTEERFSETVTRTINEVPVQPLPIQVSVPIAPPPMPAQKPWTPAPVEKPWTPKPFAPSPVALESQESLRRNSIRETAKAIESKIKEIESTNYELRAPGLVRETLPRQFKHVPFQPAPVPARHDIFLQPEPPAEICFAPQTAHEQTSSFAETIERSSSRGPPCGPPSPVRMMPPSPQNYPKISIIPVQTVKDRESSGYAADTEESRFTSNSRTEHFESSSARQYFQRIDQSNKPFSPFENEFNRVPQKVRSVIDIKCFCVY